MSRIAERFEILRKAGRKALIPYVTAGDPQPETTLPLMHAMVTAGADIIELGVPFSDPMAEGPVIQRAMERALAHDVTLAEVLDMVRQFRKDDTETPVLLMGYLNPVEVMGYVTFADAAAAAGVDGILIVDLPPEEAEELVDVLHDRGLDIVFLVSPTSNDARIRAISGASSGFVYYVSLKGVTGAGHLDTAVVAERVNHIKTFSSLPVGVGFGIRDAASAASIAQVADAVIVGSALVRQVEQNVTSAAGIEQGVTDLLREMRQGMDAATV